ANTANIDVRLKPANLRNLSQSEIMTVLSEQMNDIPGAQYFVQQQNSQTTLTFDVTGEDYNQTLDASFKLLSALQKNKNLKSLYIHISMNQPHYNVMLNRVLANSLGI